jgi:O-antigen ligase
MIVQLVRLTPWLLLWLPLALVLAPLADDAPNVPFSTISVLTHKPGNAAIAALLALGCMWVFADTRSARSRAWWSTPVLIIVALAGTQNRGGLIAAVIGGTIGLAFLRNRLGLAARIVVTAALGLGLASMLSLKVPIPGLQGREFSASQLVANVMSLGSESSPGNLEGTVRGRQELWTRILDKQVADGHLVDGSGFGQNLAAEVGVYDEGKDTLRNPHNSHLHILARMGVVGISLWIALWVGWYWRLVVACRRLAQRGLYFRRKVAVMSMMVTTAILVSSTFDPQLEGPQVAALLWTTFGVGVAVTTDRPWFNRGDSAA